MTARRFDLDGEGILALVGVLENAPSDVTWEARLHVQGAAQAYRLGSIAEGWGLARLVARGMKLSLTADEALPDGVVELRPAGWTSAGAT